jgi:hypothetical protein
MRKPIFPITHLLALAGVIAAGGTAVASPESIPATGTHTVAVLPPSGENVDPALLDAARELLVEDLSRTGLYKVIQPSGKAGAEEPTPQAAAQEASALGADEAIVVRIVPLASAARLRLTVYAAPSADVLYWDSVLLSGGPAEMDAGVQRLVHAMQAGKPVRDSAEIDSVLDHEAFALNRRQANKAFGVRLSTLVPFNTSGPSSSAVPVGGLFWLYDARSWMADLSFDLGGHGGSSLIDAALGAYYPFLRQDFTPYVGGVVRWAHLSFGGQGAGGFVYQPTAGVLFGRLTSVQLRAEVGYFIDSFAEAENAPVGTPAPSHYSHGFVASVGLGF